MHLKTWILLAGLTALFGAFGLLLAGPTGMVIALLIAVAMNLFTYWNSDRMVLGMYNAQPVEPDTANPLLRTYYNDIAELAGRAGLPMPGVYVIDSEQPNAFATGRDPQHAAVCATVGLLQRLDRGEIRGVMAHELAHVKNRDTLTMTITASIAGAISSLANFAMVFGGSRDDEGRGGNVIGAIAMAILAPIAAMLVQMAISRTREYAADRVGGEISGDPEALARALHKIEAYAQGLTNYEAERNPATAHLFIINPLHGGGLDNWFSTHPSTENRVQALIRLAQEMGGRKSGKTFTAVPTTDMG